MFAQVRVHGFDHDCLVFAAQLGDGAAEVQSGHDAGERLYPVVFDVPAVLVVAVFFDGIEEALAAVAVAEDAVLKSLLQCVQDGGGGEEFGVGYPHRQDVAAAVFVPFVGIALGAGVAAA